MRIADGKHYLCEQALDANADDLAGQLIAAADAAVTLASLCRRAGTVFGQEGLQTRFADAVMTTGGFDSFELAGENPLLDRDVADSE